MYIVGNRNPILQILQKILNTVLTRGIGKFVTEREILPKSIQVILLVGNLGNTLDDCDGSVSSGCGGRMQAEKG